MPYPQLAQSLGRWSPAVRVTIICGACEHEWSGDTTQSRVCPKCGNDGEIESHVVRQDGRNVCDWCHDAYVPTGADCGLCQDCRHKE